MSRVEEWIQRCKNELILRDIERFQVVLSKGLVWVVLGFIRFILFGILEEKVSSRKIK